MPAELVWIAVVILVAAAALWVFLDRSEKQREKRAPAVPAPERPPRPPAPNTPTVHDQWQEILALDTAVSALEARAAILERGVRLHSRAIAELVHMAGLTEDSEA